MSMNSQLNPPSTVALHRTNYLTYIDEGPPRAKKRKSQFLIYICDNSENESTQPSQQAPFYTHQNKNKFKLPRQLR